MWCHGLQRRLPLSFLFPSRSSLVNSNNTNNRRKKRGENSVVNGGLLGELLGVFKITSNLCIHQSPTFGLSGSSVINLVASSPEITRRDLKSVILPKMKLLKSILGSDENVSKAIRRYPWLLPAKNHVQVQENVILLQKYGLTSERIQKLVVLNPKCLLYRPELLQGSLVNKARICSFSEYILQHLALLTLSLQNRIVPRAAVFHVLKEKISLALKRLDF
ncbi:hypothetical protein Dimus_032604 [Dionaea muscipula]